MPRSQRQGRGLYTDQRWRWRAAQNGCIPYEQESHHVFKLLGAVQYAAMLGRRDPRSLDKPVQEIWILRKPTKTVHRHESRGGKGAGKMESHHVYLRIQVLLDEPEDLLYLHALQNEALTKESHL